MGVSFCDVFWSSQQTFMAYKLKSIPFEFEDSDDDVEKADWDELAE